MSDYPSDYRSGQLFSQSGHHSIYLSDYSSDHQSDYPLFIFLFPDFQNPTVANFATIQKGKGVKSAANGERFGKKL